MTTKFLPVLKKAGDVVAMCAVGVGLLSIGTTYQHLSGAFVATAPAGHVLASSAAAQVEYRGTLVEDRSEVRTDKGRFIVSGVDPLPVGVVVEVRQTAGRDRLLCQADSDVCHALWSDNSLLTRVPRRAGITQNPLSVFLSTVLLVGLLWFLLRLFPFFYPEFFSARGSSLSTKLARTK